MAYLLTQIVFSLVLAGVFGVAVGWLVNGYRASGRQKRNDTENMRQALALSQAETDNKMIEDDFRELKHRSEGSIALLKEEIKQIPELKKNLEKSQTLVRQLLQKHDAELRQLSAGNSVLKNKVRELENREKAVTRLQMDLNTERLKMRSERTGNARSSSPDSTLQTNHQTRPAVPFGHTQVAADTPNDAHGLTLQTEIPLELVHEVDLPDSDSAQDRNYNSEFSRPGSSIDDILDKADDVLTRFRDDPSVELDAFQLELDQELDAIRHDLTTEAEPLLEVPNSANLDDVPVLSKSHALNNKPTTESTVTSEQPFHQVFGATFTPPEHTDNLQQIFGIGPVTENTLNLIGITSYEQLAMFTREHIEYVAEVLQIFPGRIERDNWVGSASKLVASRNSQSDRATPPSSKLSGQFEDEFEDSLEDA